LWREWLSYFEAEPFGSVFDDIRHAQLLALLAEINRNQKKRSRPYSPNDFLPKHLRQHAKPNGEALRQQLLMWAQAHNAALKAKQR